MGRVNDQLLFELRLAVAWSVNMGVRMCFKVGWLRSSLGLLVVCWFASPIGFGRRGWGMRCAVRCDLAAWLSLSKLLTLRLLLLLLVAVVAAVAADAAACFGLRMGVTVQRCDGLGGWVCGAWSCGRLGGRAVGRWFVFGCLVGWGMVVLGGWLLVVLMWLVSSVAACWSGRSAGC